MLLAFAPEVDLRYERVYACLQDDVSRRRPTVDLALNLLCAAPEAKLGRRWHFTEDAPLVRYDVVRLVAESSNAEPPLLAHALKLDERIVRRLLGDRGVDPVLRGICAIVEPADSGREAPVLEDRLEALVALVRQACVTGELLCLYLSGPPDGPSVSLPPRSRAVSACRCLRRASMRRWPAACPPKCWCAVFWTKRVRGRPSCTPSRWMPCWAGKGHPSGSG